MRRNTIRIAAALSTTVLVTQFSIQSALAVHDIVGCGDQSELEPLYEFIHQAAALLFAIGGVLAVIGLAYAGLAIMWGSEDAKVEAIRRVQQVLIGVGILWTSPFIVSFLLVPIDPCTGGV